MVAKTKEGREPATNVGGICADCAQKRKALWQKKNKNTEIFENDFCRLGFEYKVGKKTHYEWMWVRVVMVVPMPKKDKAPYKAVLCNDPIYVKAKCGDTLEFSHDEVAGIIRIVNGKETVI